MSIIRSFWLKLGMLFLVVFFLGMVYVWSVLKQDYISSNAMPITLSLKLQEENTCSRVSPEFKFDKIPENTDLICLSVRDLNIDHDHGGGCVVVPEPSVRTVNAGALLGYRGPCPKTVPHSYRFRLEARTEYDLVVGLAERTLACCNNIAE